MGRLTLTFLGVGSAFAKRNWQSNALVEAWADGPDRQSTPDDTLLIDFGSTGPIALHALRQKGGFEYLDHEGLNNYPAIRNVLVTHQHADHVGGLEELAAMNLHVFRATALEPLPPPRLITTMVLLDSLWTHTLSGGLSALSGRTATLEDYFVPTPLRPLGGRDPDRFTLLDRFDVQLVPTDHVRIHARFDWPSYAVLFTDRRSGQTVFYSGDTRFDRSLIERYVAPSRWSFHDVQLIDDPDPVHARLSDLRTLPEAIRRKMYLYHLADAWDDPAFTCVEREFAGFAGPQQRYDLFS